MDDIGDSICVRCNHTLLQHDAEGNGSCYKCECKEYSPFGDGFTITCKNCGQALTLEAEFKSNENPIKLIAHGNYARLMCNCGNRIFCFDIKTKNGEK